MLLTINEVAKEFRVHPRTIKRWVKAGRLAVIRLSPNTVRVDESEIQRLKYNGLEGGGKWRG